MFIRSCWLMMLSSSVPCCLSVLSTLERGVLKSPTIFLDLSVSFLFFNGDHF